MAGSWAMLSTPTTAVARSSAACCNSGSRPTTDLKSRGVRVRGSGFPLRQGYGGQVSFAHEIHEKMGVFVSLLNLFTLSKID
jgi:hypothetical protein